MPKSWWKKLREIDVQLDKAVPLLICLLVLVILRLPSFLEPYWSSDESQMLAVGIALEQGARLYSQVKIDQPPLMSYLAMVPNHVWLRGVMLAWMMGTVSAFYYWCKQLHLPILPTTLATITLVCFTSLPWFSGNVPNAALVALGLVVLGGKVLSKTELMARFLGAKTEKNQTSSQPYVLAGVLFGLAMLTTLSAISDLLAFLALGWFIIAGELTAPTKLHSKQWYLLLSHTTRQLGWIVAGVATVISCSLIYFLVRGSAGAYVKTVWLDHFNSIQPIAYSGEIPLLQTFFTLPGILLCALIVWLGITFLGQKLTPVVQFAVSWLVIQGTDVLLTTSPTLISFLPLAPAFSLLVGSSIVTLSQRSQRPTLLNWWPLSLSLGTVVIGLALLSVLQLKPKPALAYYFDTMAFAQGSLPRHEYYQSFDPLTADNYRAAQIIQPCSDRYLFIWGNNPSLYALSQKAPLGSINHTKQMIDDTQDTELVMQSLIEQQPTFVVVMKNEPEQLPELGAYLQKNYLINTSFDNFDLWKKR